MSKLSREQVARWDLSPGDTVERDVYGHFVEFYEYAVLRAKLEEQTERAEKAELVLADLRLRLNCPMEAPSCLVCGQQAPFVIQHLEAAIGVCEECRSASNTLTDIRAQMGAMTQAVGLATTCVPSMEIDSGHPIEMMQQVCAEFENLKQQLTEAQTTIAELETREKAGHTARALHLKKCGEIADLQATVTAQREEIGRLREMLVALTNATLALQGAPATLYVCESTIDIDTHVETEVPVTQEYIDALWDATAEAVEQAQQFLASKQEGA